MTIGWTEFYLILMGREMGSLVISGSAKLIPGYGTQIPVSTAAGIARNGQICLAVFVAEWRLSRGN